MADRNRAASRSRLRDAGAGRKTGADEPLFMISIVSQMLEIHPQTLRMYEREGLVKPSRTEGNTRLYSPNDVDRLRMVLRLTRELGVNLAGVEVILGMREKIEDMQREIDRLRRLLESQPGRAVPSERSPSQSLMHSPPSKMIKVDIEAE